MFEHEGDGFGIQPDVQVFSVAPDIGTPKCASNISGMLGSIAATVWPRPMPRFCSAEANRRHRA